MEWRESRRERGLLVEDGKMEDTVRVKLEQLENNTTKMRVPVGYELVRAQSLERENISAKEKAIGKVCCSKKVKAAQMTLHCIV